jgi:hypothetical protein
MHRMPETQNQPSPHRSLNIVRRMLCPPNGQSSEEVSFDSASVRFFAETSLGIFSVESRGVQARKNPVAARCLQTNALNALSYPETFGEYA